jgi:hypothetical protein
MRKSMLAASAVAAPMFALAVATPAGAQAGLEGSFTVLFPQGHPASNAPCPEDAFCGVGSLAGWGAATITIADETFDEIAGSDCLAVTRVEDIELESGAGTLEIDSAGTFCRPGGSGGARASDRSYGSPGTWTFNFDVDGANSSGVFAGANGTGAESMVTAGGVGSWHLSGTLTVA